jgi:RimJ/RimL family protein N-acetyltransferase
MPPDNPSKPSSIDSFATARLSAERLRQDHLDDLIVLHLDEEVSRYLGGTRTASQTAAYLEANLAHWDQRGFGLWIVRDRAGRFLGRAGIRPLDIQGVREIEIAYTFHQAAWGQGYASEIAEALRNVAFGPLGLPQLVGIVMIANLPSRRVLEKTGFAFERTYVEDGHELDLLRMLNPRPTA